ncbi:peptidoglycan-binding domain-containing protein [Phreatobacter sp.]|uniref:peptidoglycan-binding domain-containing protein n=1 Tax=Phreatobacter sp. TaxID=1966341 RepID=UPI003F6F043A
MREAAYDDEDAPHRRGHAFDPDEDAPPRRSLWRAIIGDSPGDRLALACLLFVGAGIAFNALVRQTGPHPAPLFGAARSEVTAVVRPAPLPPERPAEVQTTASVTPRADTAPAVEPAARPRAEIVTDIQRELARRGLYDGAVDGLTGPKTDAAIRRYETQAGLRASGEASETLLGHMRRGQRPAPARQTTRPASPQSIGDLIDRQGRAPAPAERPRTSPQQARGPQSITDLIASQSASAARTR